MPLAIVIGLISGIISGMGVGGGTVLIPALVFIYGMEQHAAQSINLIYFIPTAAIALITHIKEGNIEKQALKPFILWGALSAAAGAFLAAAVGSGLLRKIFGVFLLIMGIVELVKKEER